jgi:hypothetical protein
MMTNSRDSDPFFFDPEGEKDVISRRRERAEMMAQLRAERAEMMRDDTDYHANDVDD